MIKETPIELEPVKRGLKQQFHTLVAPAALKAEEDRERNFYSRALAAYAMHKLAGCNPEEAARTIVDGGGDGGIDAIHHSANTNTLWVVQSKFVASGHGTPDLEGIAKFKLGMENLLQGRFDAFRKNSAWAQRIPEMEQRLPYAIQQIRGIVIFSGIEVFPENDKQTLQDLIPRFGNGDPDYLSFNYFNLTSVHHWMLGLDDGLGVSEVDLTLHKPGWVREPYETLFGLVSLKEISQLYQQHGKRLIAANIRDYKGSTEVNQQILDTLNKSPEHFFYLNNGMTAYCSRLEVSTFSRGNTDQKRIRARGFSIVNGAQTLGSIHRWSTGPEARDGAGFVFLKVISLERCEDDRAFAEQITQSTNHQNRILLKDFIAQREEQARIANMLRLSDIAYHYKEGEHTPPPGDSDFTFDECLTACACLVRETDCDLVARIRGHRESLYALEPDEGQLVSRYERVFPPDKSVRQIWRAVQVQRVVLSVMANGAASETGNRKTFFENARWLLLHVTFCKLQPELKRQELKLSADEIDVLTRFVQEAAEILWSICRDKGMISESANTASDASRSEKPQSEKPHYEQPRHFRAVFGSANDCQNLKQALMRRLNGGGLSTNSLDTPAPRAHEEST